MSHQPNILLFSTILGLTFLLFDVYVLRRWMQHAKNNHLHSAWYLVPWGIAAVMLGAYCFVMFRRHFFRMDGADATLFGFVTLWYLPKMGIAIFLGFRDSVRAFGWLRMRIRNRNNNNVPIVQAPSESAAGPTRREFLGTAAWSLSAVPFIMVGRGMWSTLYDFQVANVDLVLNRLPRVFDGMRIAQISDIHAGSFPDHTPFQEVRYILETIKPDAIVVTGDFVNQLPQEMAVIAREYAKLRAPYGVYASLGNHDHYNSLDDHARLVNTIRDFGTKLLINQHSRIEVGGESLIIAGTDNTGFRQSFARLDETLRGVTDDEPVILLAHDPTFWEKEVVPKGRVDVMLSGHTHGGQFGVQALGFEWSPAQMIYKQWAGHYAKGDQQLYVNRGIGTVGPPMRIGIPPEITVFTLRTPTRGNNMA